MQEVNILYLLPDIFKLFYTFSYFFQTSIDLTCRDRRCDPTTLYRNLCKTKLVEAMNKLLECVCAGCQIDGSRAAATLLTVSPTALP